MNLSYFGLKSTKLYRPPQMTRRNKENDLENDMNYKN
jgi:hypothetical protein